MIKSILISGMLLGSSYGFTADCSSFTEQLLLKKITSYQEKIDQLTRINPQHPDVLKLNLETITLTQTLINVRHNRLSDELRIALEKTDPTRPITAEIKALMKERCAVGKMACHMILMTKSIENNK